MLGVCYTKGEGVPKDYTNAVKWYSKAAEQGDAYAQCKLGTFYTIGVGVAKDDVIAYMWANLAVASGNEDAIKMREYLEKKMTAEQVAEAQRLSRDWKPRPHQGE
jgi:TPR repeat protein